MEVGGGHRAEQEVGAAPAFFDGGLRGEVGTVGGRSEQERRRPDVVAIEEDAPGPGSRDDGRHVLHLQDAESGRFDPDEPGPIVGEVGEAGADQRVVNLDSIPRDFK